MISLNRRIPVWASNLFRASTPSRFLMTRSEYPPKTSPVWLIIQSSIDSLATTRLVPGVSRNSSGASNTEQNTKSSSTDVTLSHRWQIGCSGYSDAVSEVRTRAGSAVALRSRNGTFTTHLAGENRPLAAASRNRGNVLFASLTAATTSGSVSGRLAKSGMSGPSASICSLAPAALTVSTACPCPIPGYVGQAPIGLNPHVVSLAMGSQICPRS
jgi:hypothetical protein